MKDDYLYYDDGSGYPYDEYEYDDEYYDDDYDDDMREYGEQDYDVCSVIGCIIPAGNYCQCCTMPLCHMHNETGCGFCKQCSTRERINKQQKVL